MSYLLDTMVVSYFLQAEREAELAAAARRCPMAVVEQVFNELRNDPARGGRSFEKWFAGSNIEMRPITADSPAFTTYAQLVDPNVPARKNVGERASIAFAAFDPSLTFVSQDKNGMWLALRELWTPGERVVGVPVFLRRLFDAEALREPSVADDIMKHANAPRPTWWASWRASFSSKESV